MSKQSKEFLEWSYLFLIVVLCFAVIVFIWKYGHSNQNELRLEQEVLQLKTPEVIFGNLYVGYEDGVRIGYHQDYNGTWYRCVRSCIEIQEEK